MKRKELKDPMKLKNKILLAASGLLVLSGAAATTGTFAWFTANNTAEVKGTLSVGTNTAGLVLKVTDASTYAEGTTGMTGTTDTQNTNITSFDADKRALTDVSSGDGINFAKATLENKVVNGSVKEDAKMPYVLDFKLDFSTNPTGQKMALYLSSSSYFTNQSSDTDTKPNIAAGFRLAILNADETTCYLYYAPYRTADKLKYLKAGDSSETNVTGKVLDSNYYSATGANDYKGGDNAPTAGKAYITTMENGSVTLHARIWLEGTDEVVNNDQLKAITAGSIVFNGIAL